MGAVDEVGAAARDRARAESRRARETFLSIETTMGSGDESAALIRPDARRDVDSLLPDADHVD